MAQDVEIRRRNAAAAIHMSDVSKSFGSVGVHNVTLDVPAGTILGLVGPSGCGKTTTVRLLTGVYRPDSGTLQVLGEVPGHLHSRTRTHIGYMPQQYVLSKHMTVWDTLGFVASLYGMSWYRRGRKLREVLEFVELDDARRTLVGNLSGGMQRRLALACALAHKPGLIFADEPTAGIDPILRHRFWERFQELRNNGSTLFVTTQYIGEIALCDRVAVMRDGKLLYVDTPDGLRRKALGGDSLSLRVEPPQTRKAAALIDAQPYVREVRLSRRIPGLLSVTVDEASAALPQIIQLLTDNAGITLQNAEEDKPSFDDIFVQLMDQYDQEHGIEEEATAGREVVHA